MQTPNLEATYDPREDTLSLVVDGVRVPLTVTSSNYTSITFTANAGPRSHLERFAGWLNGVLPGGWRLGRSRRGDGPYRWRFFKVH